MRKVIIILFLVSTFVFTKAQTFTADSLHCAIYKDTSQKVCTDYDTIKLDLNNDGKVDIKLYRKFYWDTCYYASITNCWLSKWICIEPDTGFTILFTTYYYRDLATKLQYGLTINPNNYHFPYIPYRNFVWAYFESMYITHCGVVYWGWNQNDDGYFSVREINNSDTTYYLIRLKITNNASCIQIINDTWTNISDIPNDDLKVTFENNILKINLNKIENSAFIEIYNISGTLISKEKIKTTNYKYDFKNNKNGMYLVLINNKKLVTKKIIKLTDH